MKVWLSQHAQILAATFATLMRTPAATLLNIGAIGVALALPAGFYVGLANVQGFAHRLVPAPQLSLFLALDANGSDVAQIERRLKQDPGVSSFTYISREQALRDMKASTGLADVVESLDHNPLPDAFIVNSRYGAPQALEALRGEFRGWPKVAHVQLDSAWAQRLDAALRLGRFAVLMLAALLAFALLAVTFNTIRLQIMTRRTEIEVIKLIGATDPFIRRPFLYYGALLGMAGGLAAWTIVWAGVVLLNDSLADLSRLYGIPIQLTALSSRDGLSLLLFSGWLGWFGAWLSTSHHLSQFEPR